MSIKDKIEQIEDATKSAKQSLGFLNDDIENVQDVWSDLLMAQAEGDRDGFAVCWNELKTRIKALSCEEVGGDIETIQEALL